MTEEQFYTCLWILARVLYPLLFVVLVVLSLYLETL
jgi:hypothetical protein